MKYDDNILKKVTACGIFQYDVQRVINVLDLNADDEKQFIIDFANPDHPVSKAFKKGIDQAEFAIDSALFQKVQKGDLKALALYNERREMQEQKKR